jgi:hypothetical protein
MESMAGITIVHHIPSFAFFRVAWWCAAPAKKEREEKRKHQNQLPENRL